MAKTKTHVAAIELPLSRGEAILKAMRADILSGHRAPGERLNIDDLALAYGVSRMPVRDALKQLESEGLVKIFAHRGVEVSQLDAGEIEELFGIRVILEQKAAELAVPRLTAADHAEMKSILERMDRLKGRNQEWAQLNARFHEKINQASGWPKLLGMIHTLRANVERYVRAYIRMSGPENAQAQHWQLYEACVARDIALAKATVALHLDTTVRELLVALPGAEDSAATAEPVSAK